MPEYTAGPEHVVWDQNLWDWLEQEMCFWIRFLKKTIMKEKFLLIGRKFFSHSSNHLCDIRVIDKLPIHWNWAGYDCFAVLIQCCSIQNRISPHSAAELARPPNKPAAMSVEKSLDAKLWRKVEAEKSDNLGLCSLVGNFKSGSKFSIYFHFRDRSLASLNITISITKDFPQLHDCPFSPHIWTKLPPSPT